MKKVFMIIGGVVIGILVIAALLVLFVSVTSKKLVCKSNEGNITIMYNDKTITGYSTQGMTFDLEGQQKYAEQVGIEAYLDEFSTWFSTNTTGSCTR